jgi:hypothetical protein
LLGNPLVGVALADGTSLVLLRSALSIVALGWLYLSMLAFAHATLLGLSWNSVPYYFI